MESEDEGNSPHEQPAAQADNDWEPREHPANKALLSREDLDRHFGYGLKEAARRLGVCKTTLKRACRHATLSFWPASSLTAMSAMSLLYLQANCACHKQRENSSITALLSRVYCSVAM